MVSDSEGRGSSRSRNEVTNSRRTQWANCNLGAIKQPLIGNEQKSQYGCGFICGISYGSPVHEDIVRVNEAVVVRLDSTSANGAVQYVLRYDVRRKHDISTNTGLSVLNCSDMAHTQWFC